MLSSLGNVRLFENLQNSSELLSFDYVKKKEKGANSVCSLLKYDYFEIRFAAKSIASCSVRFLFNGYKNTIIKNITNSITAGTSVARV
jgi:hypothetical protein